MHLLAVALWLGMLAHLVLVSWRLRDPTSWPALRDGARRYAGPALALALVALVSGGLVALSQFTRPAELVLTTYGRLLGLKALAVGGALLMASLAHRTLTAWLAGTGGCASAAALRKATRAEVALALGATALAAVLAGAPPPKSVDAAQELLGPPPFEGPVVYRAAMAGYLAVYVGAARGQLRVWALAPSGDPAPETRFQIAGLDPGGRGVDASPRPCGPSCASSAFPWQDGTTTLTIGVSSRAWEGGSVRMAVAWPLGPDESTLLARVAATMRGVPRLDLTERVTPRAPGTTDTGSEQSGATFMGGEAYGEGGAAGVRLVPRPGGVRTLSLFVAGSSLWYAIEIDGQDRITKETIVAPGHLIERSIAYPAGANSVGTAYAARTTSVLPALVGLVGRT